MRASEMPGPLLAVPCKVADDFYVASLVFSLVVYLSAALARMIVWICFGIYSVLTDFQLFCWSFSWYFYVIQCDEHSMNPQFPR